MLWGYKTIYCVKTIVWSLCNPDLEYKKSPIQAQVNAILGNLKEIEKIVRTDDGLDRRTLVSMKDKTLGDIYQGVSFVESTIEDLLRDKK